MRNKPLFKMIFSIFLLIVMLAMAITSVMAWFHMSTHSELKNLELVISDKSISANISIDGEPSKVLENIIPGNSFLFEVDIRNFKNEDLQVRLYFSNISSAVYVEDDESGEWIPVDLLDVLIIKEQSAPDIDAYYFREKYDNATQRVGILPDKDIIVPQQETIRVEFYLIFSDVHTYFDQSTETYVSGDINLFQDKEFRISQLIIDVV